MQILIDCGAFNGDTREKYINDFDKIYCFEPIGYLANKIPVDEKTEVIKKAVWVREDTLELHINTHDELSQGSSLYADKITGGNNEKILVGAVDFSQWLRDTFWDKTRCVTVKMNIEGAEYPVIEHLCKTGAIEYIEKIMIAYHQHKIPSIPRERHEAVHNMLCERVPVVEVLKE